MLAKASAAASFLQQNLSSSVIKTIGVNDAQMKHDFTCCVGNGEKTIARASVSAVHLTLLGDAIWYIKTSGLPFKVGFQLCNSCLGDRSWYSVGGRGKAHESVGRLQWFSLMICCEKPVCSTTRWSLILFSPNQLMRLGTSLGTDPWSSGCSPGFWFSSVWDHGHITTRE